MASTTADAEVDGQQVSCSVSPEGLPEVLAALTAAGVVSLTSAPPSLEELFLDAYRTPHPEAPAPAVTEARPT